ncbi:MAG TPA: 2-dehydropantoate 2-reductase N-terminal domain-containing protein [Kofleriaceae bacterium]|nr:2-dehydropantoate 2-reductase N-terminal domain-containing protein [Kofleriaceae bacterium]
MTSVLVVGAGSVGQVYARHYQLGGAKVTFFVREKYKAEVERGFDMYPLNERSARRGEAVRFAGFDVVTRADEVAARTFDQVMITVASPALRGPWLAELVTAARDATIVALQPGLDDRALYLAAGATDDRLVQGLISLISYHAPLPGETRFPGPGMAYWFPPMGPSPFSGPTARRDAVIAALKRGKLPARKHADVGRTAGFPTAVMMPYLVALELGGWTVRGARRSGKLALGGRGAREAVEIVRARLGKPPFGLGILARPTILRSGVFLARPLIPLPLEIYLEEHFTKVGDQTREFLEGYIAKGQAAGLPTAALEELASELRLKRLELGLERAS